MALVELLDDTVDSGLRHSTVTGEARPRADVVIHGATTGRSTTWVRGASLSWAGPDPDTGDWGFVLVTRDGTTDGGDSGAPVFLADTDQLVGHVVGGAPGVYSLVQEIDYQLGRVDSAGAVSGLVGTELR